MPYINVKKEDQALQFKLGEWVMWHVLVLQVRLTVHH